MDTVKTKPKGNRSGLRVLGSTVNLVDGIFSEAQASVLSIENRTPQGGAYMSIVVIALLLTGVFGLLMNYLVQGLDDDDEGGEANHTA